MSKKKSSSSPPAMFSSCTFKKNQNSVYINKNDSKVQMKIATNGVQFNGSSSEETTATPPPPIKKRIKKKKHIKKPVKMNGKNKKQKKEDVNSDDDEEENKQDIYNEDETSDSAPVYSSLSNQFNTQKSKSLPNTDYSISKSID
eukprot:105461_1